MLELCTLGTGGTMPMPDRALSSLYVRVNGHGLLIDCGEGTQVGVRRLGWGFKCIDAILITHYHGDHCSGLPGMLLSIAKAERTEPVHIWGPQGLRRVVESLMVIVPQLPFPVVLHEIHADHGILPEFSVIGLAVTPFSLDHGVPCIGYRLYLPRKAVFLPEKARELDVPVTLWKTLQAGMTVDVNGTCIRPDDVMGSARKGITIVYATDTRPTSLIPELGQNAQAMILEGMYGDDSKYKQAIKNHHMLFEESAALALQAGCGHLYLTHFSTSLEEPEAFLPLARSIFPETDCCTDGMCLRIPYPDENS